MALFFIEAIDGAPAMIEICKRRFSNANRRVTDMRTLSLGKRFDGRLAWHSFFHLTPQDQPSMFPVFCDHAAASTALLFTGGPRHGEAIGTFHGEALYHGSLGRAEYRRLLNGNGFEVIANVAADQMAAAIRFALCPIASPMLPPGKWRRTPNWCFR